MRNPSPYAHEIGLEYVPASTRILRNYDPDFSPCGCIDHTFLSIPVGQVLQVMDCAPTSHRRLFRVWLTRTCLLCGIRWHTEIRQTDNPDFRFLCRRFDNDNDFGDGLSWADVLEA